MESERFLTLKRHLFNYELKFEFVFECDNLFMYKMKNEIRRGKTGWSCDNNYSFQFKNLKKYIIFKEISKHLLNKNT